MTAATAHEPIDAIFRALSDPTRRKVLEKLARKPASVSELAEPFDMALPSFVQHMRILEDSGLVSSRKDGRVRTFELAPKRMQVAETWLSRHRDIWEQRLDQLDDYLISLKKRRT